MTVLGIHHLGLSVADVGQTAELLRAYGFDGGDPFELGGDDAARGNGVAQLRMKVAFVSDGSSTFELIEHLEHIAYLDAPASSDQGYERWHVLSPDTVSPRDLPGVSLCPTLAGGRVGVGLVAGDPAATGELLRAIGLEPDDGSRWTLPGASVRVDRSASAASAPPVRARGRSHLALRVDDARASHARLVSAGFDCVSAPVDHEGVIRWFFVRDPGGSGELEIVQDDT